MRVNILFWKIVGVIATLFFSVCLVGACISGAYLASASFLLFLLPSVLLIVGYGPIDVTADGIAMTAPIAKYAIRWDEIRRIRYAKSHLILEGDGKRLTIPLPMFWNGKSKKGAIAALEAFVRESGITPAYSFAADFLLSKNAKVA